MARDIDLYNRNTGRGSRIPNIGLGVGQSGFTPATFQAGVYTPQKEDMSLLQRSIQTLDERKERTDQQRAAIAKALGDVKLNAAEDKWKKDYIDSISARISSAAQFGDYSAALETATRLAGEALTDPALKGRIRANEQYEEEIKRQKARVDRGDIGQNTYAWWLKNNPYQYTDIKDDNGNIIGGTEYEPTSRPVNDINWASAAMAAFKMITPYKNSTSSQGSSSVTNHSGQAVTRGKITTKPGEGISSSGGSSFSQEKVTKEEIIANMEEMLKATPDGYRQAEQAYDVAMDEFNSMVEEYNNLVAEDPNSAKAKDLAQKIDVRSKLMYRNGSKIDYKEYYARMVTDSLFAQGLAYDWRTKSTNSSSSYSITDVTGGSGIPNSGSQIVRSNQPFPGARFDGPTGTWVGPLVGMTPNTQQYTIAVDDASNNIVSAFKLKN